MGELINLNHYRKQKQLELAKQRAERKRLRHGRSKAEKKRTRSQIEMDAKLLEQKRLVSEHSDAETFPVSPVIGDPSRES